MINVCSSKRDQNLTTFRLLWSIFNIMPSGFRRYFLLGVSLEIFLKIHHSIFGINNRSTKVIVFVIKEVFVFIPNIYDEWWISLFIVNVTNFIAELNTLVK
jgi:hypothetical protein